MKKTKMFKMSRVQAYRALKTRYGRKYLEDYTPEDLQDITRFGTDGNGSFYKIDESNFKDWIYCDDLDKWFDDPPKSVQYVKKLNKTRNRKRYDYNEGDA